MNFLIGKESQSIFDIAFICYGSYDVLRLVSENDFITDLNYSDFSGKKISYTSTNNNAKFILGLENKTPNTGNTKISKYRLLEGNGYRLLENGNYRLLE